MTRRESELCAMSALAGPLVLAELGWMAMGDRGHHVRRPRECGGDRRGELGHHRCFYAIAIFASGLLLGLDTLVSQSFGAGDLEDCHHSLVVGVWLALLLIPAVMGAVWAIGSASAEFGVNASGAARRPRPYHSRAELERASAAAVYFALRRYLQAVRHRAPGDDWSLITANLVNLAGNWILCSVIWARRGWARRDPAGPPVFRASTWSAALAYVRLAA